MAVEKDKQKHSKRIFLNSFLLVFLSWLILLSWGLALWGLKDFNTAWQRIYKLAKQQSSAVLEFNDASIANYIDSKIKTVPTQKLTNKVESTRVFIKSEFDNLLTHTASDFDDLFINAFQVIQQIWNLMCITTEVIYIKFIILVASLPLFTMATTAGLVDGLNQRAIRTASLGRESSYVFHRLNHYFKYGLLLLLTLWLAMPISVNPALFFVPLSILLSVMVSITTSRFKKYL
ncbi:Fe2+/Zn2+ uptake regulation protein [Legionella busanensis]|uniref:Fe2+/Zn2+ uptake regulation protein n=1 Tax=Legionella busanensis TaxID=190655 RepID=A0A378JIC1_9GAMM|nr:TIGR03747 family integrating conjugative element membrane protein [Legionella busanensis]STX50935.1 Fe2+/Zn2+ uptake regulation protein [Legionella busanensis]